MLIGMRVNHFIIGAVHIEESALFYCNVFGYHRTDTFVDTGTGNTGLVLRNGQSPELLIVPFSKERLPNPQHIAFEVEDGEFDSILKNCQIRGIKTRSGPPLNWEQEGPSDFLQSGRKYLHFYICDPSNVNIEVMKCLP
jgi:catechol 2,3-dioxygenase-like lactoylglutathione lyase family enzyme